MPGTEDSRTRRQLSRACDSRCRTNAATPPVGAIRKLGAIDDTSSTAMHRHTLTDARNHTKR